MARAERRAAALLDARGDPARELRAEALAAVLVAAVAGARRVDERLDVLGPTTTVTRSATTSTGSSGAPTRSHSSRSSSSAIRPLPLSVATSVGSATRRPRAGASVSAARCSTFVSPSDGSTWLM